MSYSALLRLAEHFRASNEIGCALQCMQAAAEKSTSQFQAAHVNMLIGVMLLKHAKNVSECKHYLLEAISQSKQLDIEDEKVRQIYFRACSYLSDYYSQIQSHSTDAIQLLKGAIANAKASPYWHLRLILKLVRLKCDGDELDRQKYLEVGAQLAQEHASSPYLKMLFLLAKSLDQLKAGSFHSGEFSQAMSQIESLVNQQSQLPHGQLYSIKLFLQSLQLSKLLLLGEIKNAKSKLKELQQTVTSVTPGNQLQYDESDKLSSFMWIRLDEMTPMVYVFTVLVQLYQGNMDKVIKYGEKALSSLERLKHKSILSPKLKMITLEHLVQASLVMGRMNESLTLLNRMSIQMRSDVSTYPLPNMHLLVGLYCVASGDVDQAVRHVKKHPSPVAASTLALLHRQMPPSQTTLNSDNLVDQALFNIARGLMAFVSRDFDAAKNLLRDGLKVANSQDLNGVTALTLLMLGYTYQRSDSSVEEVMGLAEPARKVAKKIPDARLSFLSACLLRQLGRSSEECSNEIDAYQVCRRKAKEDQTSSQYHMSLVTWNDGLPPLKQKLSNNNDVEMKEMN